MDFSELKTKNAADLKQLLADTRDELRALKFRLRGGEMKQFHKAQEAKKTIARITMLLKDREDSQVS